MRDDGVGMPTGIPKAVAGLGTGIIEALAKHLGASIQVIALNPGVAVTISHSKNVNYALDATAAVSSRAIGFRGHCNFLSARAFGSNGSEFAA